jgi:hypothetical protein
MISKKLFDHEEDSIDYLLTNHILPLIQYEDEEKPNLNLETFNDPEVIDLLEVVHTSLLPVFNAYAKDGDLTKQQFINLIHEFGVIPDVLPQETMEMYFESLCKFHEEKDKID